MGDVIDSFKEMFKLELTLKNTSHPQPKIKNLNTKKKKRKFAYPPFVKTKKKKTKHLTS